MNWEYFKAKQREQQFEEGTAKFYTRLKIDVETVFEYMKFFWCHSLYVKGIDKV